MRNCKTGLRKAALLLVAVMIFLAISSPLPAHAFAATDNNYNAGGTAVLAVAEPATSTPPAVSVAITREQYSAFPGVRHTSNNAVRPLGGGVYFIADNNVHIEWYIRITGSWTGTMEVAYQVGSRHYMRTLVITGPGRYVIGPSRGPNGLNEIKLGASYPPLPPLPPTQTPEPSPEPSPSPQPSPSPSPSPSPEPSPEPSPTPMPRLPRHGFEFEQEAASHLDNIVLPFIHDVRVDVLDFIRGIYRVTLHLDYCDIDPVPNTRSFSGSRTMVHSMM